MLKWIKVLIGSFAGQKFRIWEADGTGFWFWAAGRFRYLWKSGQGEVWEYTEEENG